TDPVSPPPRQCPHSGGDAARPLAAGAVLRGGVRRGDLCLARRRAGAGGGSPGPGLPRRHGGNGNQRGARGDGQHPRRDRRGAGGSTAPRAGVRMKRILRDGRGRFGLLVLLVMTLLAILAPLVTTIGPAEQRDVVATRLLAPLATELHGGVHPLGSARLGRDVWARLVHGARISLGVGALGIGIGTIAGVWHGSVRAALLGATDFALALPRVVLLLLLAALWQPSALLVVLVLGLTGWMSVARLVYGESRALMARPFVDGALALGARRSRVLLRHIVPNAMTPA